MTERRRAHRYELFMPLQVMAGTTNFQSAHLRDISTHGVYFVSEQSELALRIEHLLQPQLRFKASPSYCIITACAVALAAATIVLATVTTLLHDIPERLLHLG